MNHKRLGMQVVYRFRLKMCAALAPVGCVTWLTRQGLKPAGSADENRLKPVARRAIALLAGGQLASTY
jgi:hypothetical protein